MKLEAAALEKRKGIGSFTYLDVIANLIVAQYILCMRNVEIKNLFLLSYSSLYKDCDIDPGTALIDIPQTTALEFISYLLHLYNVRKRDDTRLSITTSDAVDDANGKCR